MLTTPPLTINPPTAKEAALARDCSERLLELTSSDDSEITLVVRGHEEDSIRLPPSALRLLVAGLTELGKGHALRILPQHTELTTQEAADILNLSRPYVVRLLDEGRIPSHKVGTHRRVRLDDVLTYKMKADADRLEALKNLVAEAQELDMGY